MDARPASTHLTDGGFADAVAELASRDADLQAVIDRYGPPPFWKRSEGFPTLMYIILEQQVSLASARAAYRRLTSIADPVTPDRFLTLDDERLRGIGFSRQKTRYGRELARSIIDGRLDLVALRRMDDDEARAELMTVKGIGTWTSGIYLLMALRRSNVWPKTDLALRAAVQSLKGLHREPTADEMDAIGDLWHPWRAVAARILWHDYLSRKNDKSASRRGVPRAG